jgi:phage tail sheath gpL-like
MISKPDINISLLPATNMQGIGTRRDLIVVQSPNASANALVTGIHNKTKAELDALLDANSYARFLVAQWLTANQTGNNVKAELDLIVLAPAGGAAAAAASLVFSGTATEAGTINLSILSSKLFTKQIAVASGATHIVAGTAVVTAYAGVVAPFTVTDEETPDGTVTITATDAGTIGNGFGIEISGIPAGISVALTGFASGTGTPTVTNLFNLVGNRRYQGVLWPADLLASVATVTTFLDARFNQSNDVLDGVAFMGYSNSLANTVSAVNALNSPSLVVIGNILTTGNSYKAGPEIVHPTDYTVAEFMGIRSRRLTTSASIASVVASNASGDVFGGIALASLPYFNTPLAGTPVTQAVTLFSAANQATLNAAGFSVVGPNRAYTGSIAGSVVTTYKTDAAGNPDVSFKYLNYVDTASVCREFLFNNLKAIFVQSRLTDGDLVPGRSMENVASIKAVFKRLLAALKDEVLVRKGLVADSIIDDNLSVVVDLANRKATINSVLPIVTQLETLNVPLRMTFEV